MVQLELFEMNEAQIERKVCDLAKKRGWLPYKFASPSNRGVPDRIFLRDGVCLFVEFKAPGKKPTKLQANVHDKLREKLFAVWVIDSVAAGEVMLNEA